MKKATALILAGVIPALSFFMILTFYGLIFGTLAFVVSILFMYFVSSRLLKNPFTDMLEGNGILVIRFDSTGIIQPFIMQVQSPFIKGKLNKKPVSDVFNRETVYQMAEPIKLSEKAIIENETITVPEKALSISEYNKARFGLYQYPVLVWNDQLKSFITKDWLSEKETMAFATHNILFLNRTLEDLSFSIRNFARHVVETIRPGTNILANKWTWIIVVGFLLVLAAMFAPALIQNFQNLAQTASSAIPGNPGDAVTPR